MGKSNSISSKIRTGADAHSYLFLSYSSQNNFARIIRKEKEIKRDAIKKSKCSYVQTDTESARKCSDVTSGLNKINVEKLESSNEFSMESHS